MSTYKDVLDNTKTPVTRPIAGRDTEMVKNKAGGFVFVVDEKQQLLRFLVIGALEGTYYAGKEEHARDNIDRIRKIINKLGTEAVDLIVKVSDEGLAAKNSHAITALAIAVTENNTELRTYAYKNLSRVCRIFDHLAEFASTIKAIKGSAISGNGSKKAIARWYTEKNPDALAYQIIKYRQRQGWTQGDVLRKAHPKIDSDIHNALYRYSLGIPIAEPRIITRTEKNAPKFRRTDEYAGYNIELPKIIEGYEAAKTETSVKKLVNLITDYKLTHEMIPNEALTIKEVWEALLPHMPLRACLWNLGKMSSIGLFTGDRLNKNTKLVLNKLGDKDAIHKSRLHPMTILTALKAYQKGESSYGRVMWSVISPIVDCLDAAFYFAFKNVQPTNKNLMLALDVSGSMSGGMWSGESTKIGLTPAEISAVMALVTANVEPNYTIKAFSDHFVDLKISPAMRLDDVLKKTSSMTFGATDLSLPAKWARENKLEVDCFVQYTDSETWRGHHVVTELQQYRKKLDQPTAGNIVVACTATNMTIADPKDPFMLDVCGFSSDTPQAIGNFIALMP